MNDELKVAETGTVQELEESADGLLDFNGPGLLPGEPTDALPGTEKKIRVMAERAARREQLFHPQDGARKKARFSGKHLTHILCPGSESA